MTREGDQVGYKKPPRIHQFKPGKSGNPRGRPKGTTSFKSDLAAEMRKQTVLIEDGRRQKVSNQRAFIRSLISSALNNDKTAINTLLACLRYFGPSNDEPVAETPNLEDVAMIKSFLARTEAQIEHEKTTKTPKTRKTPKQDT